MRSPTWVRRARTGATPPRRVTAAALTEREEQRWVIEDCIVMVLMALGVERLGGADLKCVSNEWTSEVPPVVPERACHKQTKYQLEKPIYI